MEVGPIGNKGVIGRYVPQWMVEQHPDIADSANLNKYADLFKTSESDGKGQLLDGDPSFVTNGAALVTNLKLNVQVVYSGSEAALIKAAQQATAQKKPLLFYFYEPRWLFAKEKHVRVKPPPYTAGCDAAPKKVACDYPDYVLDKIASKKVRGHRRCGVPVGEEISPEPMTTRSGLGLHHQSGHDRRAGRREMGQGARVDLEAVDSRR